MYLAKRMTLMKTRAITLKIAQIQEHLNSMDRNLELMINFGLKSLVTKAPKADNEMVKNNIYNILSDKKLRRVLDKIAIGMVIEPSKEIGNINKKIPSSEGMIKLRIFANV